MNGAWKGYGRTAVVLAAALFFWPASGFARGNQNYDGPCGFDTGHACPANTPEIDPGLGTGALVLIGSWALVVRGRRKA